MKTLDNIQILEQLRLGNRKAFELIFKEYYKLLNMEAFYILQDEMEAEDTVQGFFVDFWERRLYKNIDTSLKAYLRVAIRNRCLKRIEKRAIIQKKLTDYQYTLTEIEETDTELSEPQICLEKIAANLPMQRLQAFTLVHYENKKYKDAAFEMGISINSLKTHLKLAVKGLRELLKEHK
ncbi:sigma-70 family RNA polymerase sigma factor [Pedobacter sp. NJ-S-72]